MLCGKNILMKLVGYQQPTCLCVKMEFVVGTISLSCELFSLFKARAGLKPMYLMQIHWASRRSGSRGERLGRSPPPLKPTKVPLFAMILYNPKTAFAI